MPVVAGGAAVAVAGGVAGYSWRDCWRDYLAGEATLTHVSAHDYLANRDQVPSAAMAPIPAINGVGASISRGWALALIASDPVRQSLAVEFMTQLMSPQTNADWNKAAGYLPTRQEALALWDEEDSYTRFASQQLQTAQSRPRLANYTSREEDAAVFSGDVLVRDGRVRFTPARWEKTYMHWMENVRDWCISRQLWWGHEIPAWYCDDCGEVVPLARLADELAGFPAEPFGDLAGRLLDDLETLPHADIVELRGNHFHFDFPVVPVHARAGSRIVPQGVRRSEVSKNLQRVACGHINS